MVRDAVVMLGPYPVLISVDFDAFEGEVVYLYGPNGSGKTTLLRLIAGYLSVAKGEAKVFGLDAKADRRAIRQYVGYLGHHAHLYDDLTAEENIRFAQRVTRTTEDDPLSIAKDLGLSQKTMNLKVHKLSAGQRKRVSMAIATMRRPQLLLLDEPHAALDEQGKDLVDDLMRRYAASGRTVIVASHEVERVKAASDRGYLCDRGILIGPEIAPSRANTTTKATVQPSGASQVDGHSD